MDSIEDYKKALFFMCVQHCAGSEKPHSDIDNYIFWDSAISANEDAFDLIGIKNGETVKTAMERLNIEW